MEIKGKVHCFFEQSGTFKNEFKKLGYEAYDYDIQNNFGETDYVIDLFAEIDKAYEGASSIFDTMTKDDLIIAFFPCIKFCQMSDYNQRSTYERWTREGMNKPKIWEHLKKESDERYFFYQICLKMHAVIDCSGLRLIMENPWSIFNYTNYHWFLKPSLIDNDRTLRGDYFKKPTAYWFLNCSPTYGESFQPTPKEKRKIQSGGSGGTKQAKIFKEREAKGSGKSGLCSEERSMISPDYARNFICDFIIGKKQLDINPQLEFEF